MPAWSPKRDTREAPTASISPTRSWATPPLDLVLAPGFVSHLEHSWDDPALARFLRRLASFSRLIVFDKRGTGLSDRDPDDRAPLLEDRVNDIVAVMDAAGSSSAAIMGISETAAMSLLFAATHPERTTAVIAYGAWTNGSDTRPAYPWAPSLRRRGVAR